MICDPLLLETLIAAAEKEGIPYQFKRPLLGGTDAGRMHLSRSGARASVIAVPARYIHSPSAFMDLADFEAAAALAREALHRLPRAFPG